MFHWIIKRKALATRSSILSAMKTVNKPHKERKQKAHIQLQDEVDVLYERLAEVSVLICVLICY